MMSTLFDLGLGLQAFYWEILYLDICIQQEDHGVNLSFLSFMLFIFICLWYQCRAAGLIKRVLKFSFLLHVITEQHWCYYFFRILVSPSGLGLSLPQVWRTFTLEVRPKTGKAPLIKARRSCTIEHTVGWSSSYGKEGVFGSYVLNWGLMIRVQKELECKH